MANIADVNNVQYYVIPNGVNTTNGMPIQLQGAQMIQLATPSTQANTQNGQQTIISLVN